MTTTIDAAELARLRTEVERLQHGWDDAQREWGLASARYAQALSERDEANAESDHMHEREKEQRERAEKAEAALAALRDVAREMVSALRECRERTINKAAGRPFMIFKRVAKTIDAALAKYDATTKESDHG